MRLSHRLKDFKGIQQCIKHDLNILEKDKYIIKVRGGNGGTGLSRYDGCGGRGGNVLFVPRHDIALSDVAKSIGKFMTVTAKSGEAATKARLVGSNAQDSIVDVPLGVEVVNEDSGVLIARCDSPFQKYLIAKGGDGGRRENFFKNEKGEIVRVGIHVKLRPNLALLGFPNAGKSTLMKALVPANRIKIANYAFTTKHPQMALWKEEKEGFGSFSLSVADLPGVIEGASRNRGKGFSFLKHIQNADVILLVVDWNGFQLKNDLNEEYRSVLECIALLNREIEMYNDEILKKPFIVVINKTDLCTDKEALNSLICDIKSRDWISNIKPSLRPRKIIRIEDVAAISAKSGRIEDLKMILRHKINLFNVYNRFE